MTLAWRSEQDSRGLRRVVLENSSLRLTFLPDLGGRLWSLINLGRDEEILWHHPAMLPHAVVPGAGYDDAFAGGWDELFPSDRAVSLEGVDFPDHGEWWSQPWTWQVTEEADALRLTLSGGGFVTRHEAVRTITLPRDGSRFSWRTQITNTGDAALPYIWRHHPALPVRPGTRLHLPAATVEAIAEDPGGIAAAAFTWPAGALVGGVARDLSTLPAADCGEVWMLYATGLPEGYARLTWPGQDDGSTHGIAFTFDPARVTAVTTFATFGGWRDLQTILPEAGVGYPADLREAVAAGTCGVLGVGETVVYEVGVAVW
ncbi:MAG: DUF5107 domain-containing protein [Thermomicrobiales bacterium]|nr:DUF5107 domain-containing protein [Thermomicrobiales bacterium]